MTSHHAVIGSSTKHENFHISNAVTLNYCAALGLMEVGVLKKPGMWEYERMTRPAKPDSNPAAVQQETGADGVIDMSNLDSDDE